MARVLITGVAGHLGSKLAAWLLDNVPRCEVVGLDNLICGYEENVPPGVVWNTPTIGVDKVYASDIDYVFHFAAYAAEGLSPFIRRFNYMTNLLATADVVNFCIERRVKRLVFTSSMAVYGRGRPPFSESDNCFPIDPYGIAKRASELDIMAAGEQHGLDWTIIRPHNIFGPGQSIWQKTRNVFGIWMSRHLQGLPLLVYGDGEQRRAFSYIDDCVPCLWRAATGASSSRQIINLGGTKDYSLNEAAEALREVMGGGSIAHVEPRHEVKEAFCTYQKSVDLLGYRDLTTLREGLMQMWAWARWAWDEFPERRETHMVTPLEIDVGLYPFWRDMLCPVR
jgi:UDP-glucose 4-epimerase